MPRLIGSYEPSLGFFVTSNFDSERAGPTGSNSAQLHVSRTESRTKLSAGYNRANTGIRATESESFTCIWLMKNLYLISNNIFDIWWQMFFFSIVNEEVAQLASPVLWTTKRHLSKQRGTNMSNACSRGTLFVSRLEYWLNYSRNIIL